MPFTPIDMEAVTRLTRAGRLGEAMALLQGRTATADPPGKARGETDDPRAAEPPRSTLDMAAPSSPGGAWTAAGPRRPPEDDAASGTRASEGPGSSQMLRTLRDRLTGMGAMQKLGEGLGSSHGTSVAVPDGARFEARTFVGESGERAYKVFVPSGYTGQALPVVVMLHGCTQSPDDFAAGTRMNTLAEEQTFLVAYPAQARSANAQKCWNWFNVGDQRREGGEPALIAGIADAVVRAFSADPTRVYVAGLSAGGAAAAILAMTHPDVFAAVGIHSGLACGAATDLSSALAAMKGGGAAPPRAGGVPVPTIVFHGDADRTVSPVNAERIVAQVVRAGIADEVVTRGEVPGGTRYTRSVRSDAAGHAVLEQWTLHGIGHAWSGGSPDGTYTDPRGPDASREMVRFFMAHTHGNAGIETR